MAFLRKVCAFVAVAAQIEVGEGLRMKKYKAPTFEDLLKGRRAEEKNLYAFVEKQVEKTRPKQLGENATAKETWEHEIRQLELQGSHHVLLCNNKACFASKKRGGKAFKTLFVQLQNAVNYSTTGLGESNARTRFERSVPKVDGKCPVCVERVGARVGIQTSQMKSGEHVVGTLIRWV